jgi:Protein of unknown function (DUF2917)
MQKSPPALTLPACQTRMVNASQGLRLEVQSGCLWLTRPGDAVDRFLVAGASIELHENQVLIQADRNPCESAVVAARYALRPLLVSLATPMPAAPAISRASLAMPRSDRSLLAKLGWLAPSAWLFMERR